MLPALCSLFAALACVSGVTVVTQNPPVLDLKKGEEVTMHCNLGSVTGSTARWYKQVPGGNPQHVIRHYHGWSSPKYGSGFSSPKFTSTFSSKSDYTLIIKNVEVGDSAVYYCHTWDDSAKEHVFGQGTKLMVEDSAQAPPVLTVLPPSSQEPKSDTATLVCVARHMSVGFADVRWLLDGNSVAGGVVTSSAEQQPDKKFQLSSYLTIDRSEWEKDKAVTCQVSAGAKSSSVQIKQSECGAVTMDSNGASGYVNQYTMYYTRFQSQDGINTAQFIYSGICAQGSWPLNHHLHFGQRKEGGPRNHNQRKVTAMVELALLSFHIKAILKEAWEHLLHVCDVLRTGSGKI